MYRESRGTRQRLRANLVLLEWAWPFPLGFLERIQQIAGAKRPNAHHPRRFLGIPATHIGLFKVIYLIFLCSLDCSRIDVLCKATCSTRSQQLTILKPHHKVDLRASLNRKNSQQSIDIEITLKAKGYNEEICKMLLWDIHPGISSGKPQIPR